MEKKNRSVMIKDTKLLFRNFEGVADKYNNLGRRNFNITLTPEMAISLREQGFNVRELDPKEEGDVPQAILQVIVNFNSRNPPKIMLIKAITNKKQMLNSDTVKRLDWAEIVHVDLVINPYEWTNTQGSGITAYLKSLYVTIAEDDLEAKYEDEIASATAAIGGCGNCEACDGSCGHEH